MHITATELDVLPSAVAIISAYLGKPRTTAARANDLRPGSTYIDLLRGVHLRNAQLDDTYTRPIDRAPRTPTKSQFDSTIHDETLFAAILMAYASPKVNKLWGEFAILTHRVRQRYDRLAEVP